MRHRRDPAHGVLRTWGGPTIVFITANTRIRKPLLDNPRMRDALCSLWSDSSRWTVGRYVIMPDHVHLFASPTTEQQSLEVWMRYWKHALSQKLSLPKGFWQQGHWDTRMRSQAQYEEKWNYVLDNPVRKGLVERPEDWPYSGELHVLRW